MKKAFSKSRKGPAEAASLPLSQQPEAGINPFAQDNPFSDKQQEVESTLAAYRAQQQSPGFGTGGSTTLDDVALWPTGGAAPVPPPAPAPVESWVNNNAYVPPVANPFQDAGEHTSVPIPGAWASNGNSE